MSRPTEPSQTSSFDHKSKHSSVNYHTSEARVTLPIIQNTSRRTFLRSVFAVGGVGVTGCTSESDDADELNITTEPFETTTRPPTPAQPPSFELTNGPTVGVERVASGLTSPVQLVDPADGTARLLVADQTGLIFVVTDEGLQEELFLDLRDRMVTLGENLPPGASQDERGLLGLAFHPNFSDNRKFYVRYSAPLREGAEDGSHTEVLSEFQATTDLSRGDPTTERVLIEFPSPLVIHQAGAIVFGPDGNLYVAMGDGGMDRNGQDIQSNLLGSILRIDVDVAGEDRPYGIPRDNPLVGRDGLDEQFAWGFRNPWRMAFSDDDLYVADVGSQLYEEVNRVTKGSNYGWSVKEGTACVELNGGAASRVGCPKHTDDGVPIDHLQDPMVQYPRKHDDQIVGFAVVGGYVYTGDEIPALRGQYVFGDYSRRFDSASGSIFTVEPSESMVTELQRVRIAGADDGQLGRAILSFGRDRRGTLYVCTTNQPPAKGRSFDHRTGEIYRIESQRDGAG